MKIPYNRICFLDLFAEETLKPEDSNNFDLFIFGGILGDNPPKYHDKVIKEMGFISRNLTDIQMSTDTAILVTKMIIEN